MSIHLKNAGFFYVSKFELNETIWFKTKEHEIINAFTFRYARPTLVFEVIKAYLIKIMLSFTFAKW